MQTSLPFKIPDLYGGLGEAFGRLSFDGNQLRLEYQTKDSMFGIVKAPVRTVLIDLAAVAKLSVTKGVFRSSLRLQLHSYRLAAKLPVKDDGELRLIVAKKYFPDIQALETEIRSVLTNRELDDLLEESREFLQPDLPAPPPPPPPS